MRRDIGFALIVINDHFKTNLSAYFTANMKPSRTSTPNPTPPPDNAVIIPTFTAPAIPKVTANVAPKSGRDYSCPDTPLFDVNIMPPLNLGSAPE